MLNKVWYVKPFLYNTGAWQTDRQTDKIAISIPRVCCADARQKRLIRILMRIGTCGPPGQGMKRSSSGVTKSKAKVTRGRRYDLETWQRNHCRPLRFSSSFLMQNNLPLNCGRTKVTPRTVLPCGITERNNYAKLNIAGDCGNSTYTQ